jgi:hypothetical protein
MEDLCRLCGTSSQDLINFQKAQLNIHEVLSNFGIKLKKSEFLHELICTKCTCQLDNFCSWMKTVRSVQRIFEGQVAEGVGDCFVKLERMEEPTEAGLKMEPIEIPDVELDLDDEEIGGAPIVPSKPKQIRFRSSYQNDTVGFSIFSAMIFIFSI